jgi:hypothetical protein
MNLRKVYGGTPVGNESRCETCTNSRSIRGYADSERIMICDRFYPAMIVPFKVAECNDYEDRRLPDFEQLEKIALDISVERGRKVKGFAVVKNTSSEDQDEDAVEQTARSG